MIGHLLGAAGSVEAIFSVLAIRDGVLPFRQSISIIRMTPAISTTSRERAGSAPKGGVEQSLGFGGTNGTLIFRAVD